MASKTDIANLAIADHSGDWVDDIDAAVGRTPEAVRLVWDMTLEIALAAHPWKFAKKTWRDVPSLAASQNPDPDMAYAYAKPPDCIRVFEVHKRQDFDEWDNLITTHVGPAATLIGIRRGVDIGRFSAYFNVYLGKCISLAICTPINASEAIRKRCLDEKEDAFAKAASDNGRAGKMRSVFPDSFMKARMGGGWR